MHSLQARSERYIGGVGASRPVGSAGAVRCRQVGWSTVSSATVCADTLAELGVSAQMQTTMAPGDVTVAVQWVLRAAVVFGSLQTTEPRAAGARPLHLARARGGSEGVQCAPGGGGQSSTAAQRVRQGWGRAKPSRYGSGRGQGGVAGASGRG